MTSRLPLVCVAGLLVVSATAGALGAPAPLVVAVDGSRSISGPSTQDASGKVAQLLGRLSPDASTGVIVFDDSVRWLAPVPSAPGQSVTALRTISPSGRFTVLRDALFVAASRLSEGGVILLLTDGRDENSAATVEDVARVCAQHHVRILSAGVGRAIDDRTLRRFALLTGGSYLGAVAGADGATLARAVDESRRVIAAERPSEPKAPAVATPAPASPPSPAPREAPERAGFAAAVIAAAVGALLIVAIGAGVFLWRRRPRSRTCPRCGSLLAPWETECSTCLLNEAQERQAAPEPAAQVPEGEDALPPEVFSKAPLQDQLDKTFTLQDQETLTVRERKKPPRSYFLHGDEVFSVGRAPSVNTLVLDDPTLSAQHFKIVPKEGEYFIVDLETTNGTIVNAEKVRARKLHPGDVIRAGEVEFEFRVSYRRVT